MRSRKVNKAVGLVLSLLMLNNVFPKVLPEAVSLKTETTVERRKE